MLVGGFKPQTCFSFEVWDFHCSTSFHYLITNVLIKLSQNFNLFSIVQLNFKYKNSLLDLQAVVRSALSIDSFMDIEWYANYFFSWCYFTQVCLRSELTPFVSTRVRLFIYRHSAFLSLKWFFILMSPPRMGHCP